MEITAFCILAEPHKLQYPYIESLRSVSQFADKLVINFAAAETDDKIHRHFEKESYEALLLLSEEAKGRCKVEIKLDKEWKLQKFQSYDEVRKIVQSALDECHNGWFLKFDADNVFRKSHSKKIRELFNEENDRLTFRRINVITKNELGINNASEDIYAINVTNLKRKKIKFEIGDIKNWCRVVVNGDHSSKIVSDTNLIPFNYDATFFTKERVVDFWKKTEEAYCFAEKRKNRYEGLSDDEILSLYKRYKNSKRGEKLNSSIGHPEDILEKLSSLNKDHWGYNNFGE